jgi:hypothetical protein
MTTGSTTIATPPTLVEEWVDRTGLSWAQATGFVALALVVFMVGAAYMDGMLAELFDAEAWRYALIYPVIIAYTLWTQPALKRLLDRALLAFRPLVITGDEDFEGLVAGSPVFDRRNQWLAFGVGAAFILVWQPADPLPFWPTLYNLVGGALMYGLLGWFIYITATASMIGVGWDVSVDINVFELKALEPVARWGLGIAMSYVGGITLSLLFVPRVTLSIQNIATYGILTAAPVLVFFASMLSSHGVMAEAKKRELKVVRGSLAAASQALKRCAAEGRTEEMKVLFDLIAGWGAYEKQVDAVPEWPYTAQIQRNLLVSLLLPLAAYIIPALLLEAARRLLFPS